MPLYIFVAAVGLIAMTAPAADHSAPPPKSAAVEVIAATAIVPPPCANGTKVAPAAPATPSPESQPTAQTPSPPSPPPASPEPSGQIKLPPPPLSPPTPPPAAPPATGQAAPAPTAEPVGGIRPTFNLRQLLTPNPGPVPLAALPQAMAKWNRVNWPQVVQDDPLLFLQLVRQRANETILTMSGDFFKQERIKGKLQTELIAVMKWRAVPFSIYFRFTKGDAGREVLYVDGQRNNQLLAHPGGLLGKLVKVQIDPSSAQALKDNLRPITMAGMPNMLNNALPVFEEASRNGDLGIEYLGPFEIGGRKAYAIKRVLPQKDIYPAKEFVIFIDIETLAPVGADSYGWDGKLLSKYRYINFILNPSLTDLDFDSSNKAYGF